MSYRDDLTAAMTMLGKEPRAIFVGQGVKFGGQAMFTSFEGVPQEKRIEFPVAEDLQMGFCTGLALAGFVPICVYPRMDFLLLALNQMVNHLDKLPEMSGLRPKVIIRAAVGGTKPFNPGPQHTQDHTRALLLMLKTVKIIAIDGETTAAMAYGVALECQGAVIVIEHTEKYND